MSVTSANLLAPTGRLDAGILWPGEASATTTARLDAYLTEAETVAADVPAETKDAAVKAWCYFRAYESVYQRLLARPSSGDLADQGSYAFSSAQLGGMKEQMEYWQGVFTGYIPPEDAPAGPSQPVSGAAPIRFTW